MSLDDRFTPYDADRPLMLHCACGRRHTVGEHAAAAANEAESGAEAGFIEAALVKALFPQEPLRRRFLQAVGASTARAAIASLLPLGALEAMAQDKAPLEKKELKLGFIAITCATPLIMADPLGFYKKEGLKVQLNKTAGWALIRDKMINKEHDASHFLSPMPLAISMGLGSTQMPMNVATIQNINGQAITLASKHKDKRDPRQWKGMKFAVPFEYSMHNFLLRYYLAENGVNPDTDVQIRVTPPPEMVANLRAGNIDGFLGPDPFNQRAVYDEVGFIHILSKDIWDGHPCCAFGVSEEFIQQNPNTFAALYRAILGSAQMARDPRNRELIAKVISPAAYLNQPETVISQVLTGKFADGLGGVKNVPDRTDFDPVPWQSMAVWMLTQMKRWGYIKGEVNYKQIAEKVFLLTEAKKQMKALGQSVPDGAYKKFKVMGREFDADQADAYAKSFPINKLAAWSRRIGMNAVRKQAWQSRALSLLILLVILGVWHLATLPKTGVGGTTVALTAEQIEYQKMLGKDPSQAKKSEGFPTLAQVGGAVMKNLASPFYDNGPNDKGIGIQLGWSLGRVALGFGIAALVAIPLGFLIGMSPLLHRALDPFIQVLKPISPLAWMPLALYTIKDSSISGIFVIFICSIWPMLINTAFGVAGVRREWLNVAKTLEVSRWRLAFEVILPAAAPTILTGMRISMGIAWLVIVAAEMLVGGTGIGYFVWNEWNNLSLTNVLFAILVIGIVGMLLDMGFARAQKAVTYVD